ncbi:MAG TPA: ATP-dependent zinc metalloprotease FtsH [Pirellulales bacterium]|nr:ATP-dependent zinc metalloprotease FtsH [Pirellulales bacterium]
MENKNENGLKKAEKRPPPVGANVVWWLLAIGMSALLIVMFLATKPDVDIPYGQLVRLIKKGDPHSTDPGVKAKIKAELGSDAGKEKPHIEVDEGTEGNQRIVWYSDVRNLKVGPSEIMGTVTRELRDAPQAGGNNEVAEARTDAADKAKDVAFHTGRLGFEKDNNALMATLEENGFIDVRGEDPPTPLREYFLPVLSFVVIIALFVMIMRRFGGAGSPMAFGRSRGKMYAQEDIGVTFDDVAGVDEAVDELREVVEFLRTPEKYQVLGGRIPKGVLLVGPPGTGKTLLAKAIAGEAGVPFFSLSGSDFVEMFVGVGAARVRDMFQQAEAKAPCIIFIDELDALGKTRGTSVVGGHDEREQTLNALLVEMDGFGSNSGVIVMAATNRPETLDPALLRPGRFDRHVLVDRPDVKGREKILEVHVQNVKLNSTVQLKEIAGITSGFVGADLANLVNESALLAARKGKNAVGMEEFNEGVERVTAGLEKKQRIIHEDEKQRVAYHESGHALVAYSLPNTDPVHKVSIIPRGLAALGYMMQRPEGDRYLLTQAELESRIQVLLAGTLAEEMIFDDVSTGAQNDLERATEIARSMVMDYGMSRLGRVNYRESNRSAFLAGSADAPRDRTHSEQTAREIDEEVQRILDEALEKVRQILQARRPALVGLAKRLIEREVIDADELRQIIEDNSPSPQIVPGTAAERKRGLEAKEAVEAEGRDDVRRVQEDA